jgi:uncharacterized protein YndB with AHSA1/START domain
MSAYGEYRAEVAYHDILMPSLLLKLVVATILNAGATGFVSKTTVDIAAPPARVYQTVMDRIGDWWDPEHTFSGSAHNLSIESRVGGCFCERFPAGGGVQHMTVLYLQPGQQLRLGGGLGPLQELGISGTMTWKFTGKEKGTSLEVTYAVSGYTPQGLQPLAAPVDAVLGQQIQRLKAFVETGNAAGK